MESLKRSVSYSQPNICTSQGRNKSDTTPSWLSWLLCSRQIKVSPSTLCNHLFLIGPGGCGRREGREEWGRPLLLRAIWGPYLRPQSLGFREGILGEGRGPQRHCPKLEEVQTGSASGQTDGEGDKDFLSGDAVLFE